jgi:hypothetical protein
LQFQARLATISRWVLLFQTNVSGIVMAGIKTLLLVRQWPGFDGAQTPG